MREREYVCVCVRERERERKKERPAGHMVGREGTGDTLSGHWGHDSSFTWALTLALVLACSCSIPAALCRDLLSAGN